MSGPHGIDIHPAQSRSLLEEFEGYEILLAGILGCHSASINSVIAVSARKSIVFTLNIEL